MGNVVIVAFAERSIQICEISFVGLNFLQQDCPLQLHYNCVGWRAWEATAFTADALHYECYFDPR